LFHKKKEQHRRKKWGKNGENPQPLASKKFNIQSSAFGDFRVFFHTHVKLFIVILSLLVKKIMFLLFFIFCHPWCCLTMFLLLMKLKSSLNQNAPLI